MSEIQIPFPLKGIPLKPEMTGRVKVDEVLIQTLAALCGWDGEARRLLKSSLSGSLNVTSPVVEAIAHYTAGDTNDVITFSPVETTEVMVKSHPSNTGLVWVNVKTTPTTANSWPLAAGDYINLSINNMADLQLLIAVNGEKAIILRTI